MDTAQHLVKIIKGKITKMLHRAPCCQSLFDGLTNAGVHYVGLFSSFMTKIDAVMNGER